MCSSDLNANSEPFLYHNTFLAGPAAAGAGQWAEFQLEGKKSNRAGIGAQLRFSVGGQTYLRFVDGGNGFAAQSSSRVHIGLGAAKVIDSLEVRWPSGEKQSFKNVPAGRIHRIVEGVAALQQFITKAGKD